MAGCTISVSDQVTTDDLYDDWAADASDEIKERDAKSGRYTK